MRAFIAKEKPEFTIQHALEFLVHCKNESSL